MMHLKHLLLLSFLFGAFSSIGQTNRYFIDGQSLDVLPENVHWYAVSADNSVRTCQPVIKTRSGENSLKVSGKPALVIASPEVLKYKGGDENPFKDKVFSPGSKLTVSPDVILFATKGIGDKLLDEVYSLWVYYKSTWEEVNLFSNCKDGQNLPEAFNCGLIPFKIEFYGDLTNDGSPEILLAADKDGSTMKLLIGQENGLYKILYRYSS